jgi:hypothetical protein
VQIQVRAPGQRAVDDRLEHDAADASRRLQVAAGVVAGEAGGAAIWAIVVRIPTVVDLPAPLGPSRPNTSPGSTVKSIPRTASTPPR